MVLFKTLFSTEMGVTAPSNVSTSVSMIRPVMGTVIPPFTDGVPSTTSTQSSLLVRPRLDDQNTNMQNPSREHPYDMPTSVMENVHNSVSAFAD